jgi:hypothetical protein
MCFLSLLARATTLTTPILETLRSGQDGHPECRVAGAMQPSSMASPNVRATVPMQQSGVPGSRQPTLLEVAQTSSGRHGTGCRWTPVDVDLIRRLCEVALHLTG